MAALSYSISLGQSAELAQAAAAIFVGQTSGSLLTVNSMVSGALAVGASLYGANLSSGVIAAGTVIASFGSGTGGTGSYNLNNSITASIGLMTTANPPAGGAGSVEIRIDATPTAVPDASIPGGRRALKSGEILAMLRTLEELILRDIH